MARKTQDNNANAADIAIDATAAPSTAPNNTAELNHTAEVAPVLAASACGGALRSAREKQGMSVNDIANQLRLGVKQVVAMEADDFEKLPHPSIVRGFIRNYAKLLKIDAEPLLAGYYQLAPNAAPQSFRVKSNAGDAHVVIGEPKTNFSFATFIGMIACFALIGFLFYYYTQNVKPNDSEAQGTLNAPTVNGENGEPAAVEFALPAAERQAMPLDGSTNPAAGSSATELALPPSNSASPLPTEPTSTGASVSNPASANTVTTSPSTSGPAAVDPTLAPINSVSPASAPTSSSNPPAALPPASINPTSINPSSLNPSNVDVNKKALLLEVNAREETWINITDANGKRIYSKVVAGGATDSIQAFPPVNIVVGNPNGTTLMKNGQPLDLAAHTRSKVARLTLND